MKLIRNSALSVVAALTVAVNAASCASMDGSDLIRNGQFAQARDQLERELKQNNDSAALHCNLGIALLHAKDYRPAFQHLLKATTVDPNLTPAWLNLAACYICLNEFDRAKDAYKRVENLMPQSSASLDPLIDFLSHASRTDETSSDYAMNGWKYWKQGANVNVFIAHHPRYRDIAVESAKQVMELAGLHPNFVDNKQDAQFQVDWIRPPNNAMLLERGMTSCVARNGNIVGAIVQISIANETGFEFLSDDTVRKTCLHEFMHGLGVEGHSSNVEDVMFPMLELPTVEARLTDRDRSTLKHLYATSSL